MVTVEHLIEPIEPSPPGGSHTIQVRARNPVGPGPASEPIPFRTIQNTRQRQIRHLNEWVDVSDNALANLLRQLLVRTSRSEGEVVAQAADIVQLSVDIGTKAAASALDALRVDVRDNEDGITSAAERLTMLEADLASYATVMALNALVVRVTATETGIAANAAEITALEAAHGGRTLGPEQNVFGGDMTADKAAAEALRDAYQATNPMVTWNGVEDAWLDHYDGDNDINIELRWGQLYIYQRRLNGAWVDNGEALARAAAVTGLNLRVVEQGNTLASLSEMVTMLVASVGDFTASAFQALTARVTQAENLDGSTTLSGLARWVVKTQVGDLVAGIGLYNDGTTTRFMVQADRFSIVPPGDLNDDNARVPFIVSGGRVYIDAAVIRDGTITSLKAANAFLTNLTAAHGTLAAARIGVADVFDLNINNRIRSVNYQAGTRGWHIGRDGSAEFSSAAIRDTLLARHIQIGGSLEFQGNRIIGPDVAPRVWSRLSGSLGRINTNHSVSGAGSYDSIVLVGYLAAGTTRRFFDEGFRWADLPTSNSNGGEIENDDNLIRVWKTGTTLWMVEHLGGSDIYITEVWGVDWM